MLNTAECSVHRQWLTNSLARNAVADVTFGYDLNVRIGPDRVSRRFDTDRRHFAVSGHSPTCRDLAQSSIRFDDRASAHEPFEDLGGDVRHVGQANFCDGRCQLCRGEITRQPLPGHEPDLFRSIDGVDPRQRHVAQK